MYEGVPGLLVRPLMAEEGREGGRLGGWYDIRGEDGRADLAEGGLLKSVKLPRGFVGC